MFLFFLTPFHSIAIFLLLLIIHVDFQQFFVTKCSCQTAGFLAPSLLLGTACPKRCRCCYATDRNRPHYHHQNLQHFRQSQFMFSQHRIVSCSVFTKITSPVKEWSGCRFRKRLGPKLSLSQKVTYWSRQVRLFYYNLRLAVRSIRCDRSIFAPLIAVYWICYFCWSSLSLLNPNVLLADERYKPRPPIPPGV